VGLERRVLFERELRELEYGLLSLVSLAAKALLFSVVCLQRISRGLRRSFGRQKKVTKNSRLRLLLRFVVLLPQLCLPNQTMPVWAVNGEVGCASSFKTIAGGCQAEVLEVCGLG